MAKKTLSITLALLLLIPVIPTNANSLRVWESGAQFNNGTTLNTATSVLEDSLTLASTGASSIQTTRDDFADGLSNSGILKATQGVWLEEEGDGEIVGGGDYNYVMAGNGFMEGDLIFLDTSNNGVQIIDTKGTQGNLEDDEVVVTYDTSSSPAILNTGIYDIKLEGDILYVAGDDGVSTIDTKGTFDDISDDVLVFNYTGSSTPALAHRQSRDVMIHNNLLYISTFRGLAVIDTKGTFDDAGDDDLVTTYDTINNPVLPSRNIFASSISGDLLVLTTYSDGIVLVDTKGTFDDASDDTLVTTYNTTSDPALPSDFHYESFVSDGILYIASVFSGGGLTSIDLNGSVTASDDTLVGSYNVNSTPALPIDDVSNAELVGNTLYVYTPNGLAVIDTKGTFDDASDDTLVTTYDSSSSPAISSSRIYSIIPNGELLYVNNPNGISIVDESNIINPYLNSSTYTSSVQELSSTNEHTLLWNEESMETQSVSAQTRVGDNTVYWRNDFDDGDTSDVSDYYGWGCPPDTISENSGILRIEGASTCTSYVDFWVDSELGENFFGIDSTVTARVRMNVEGDRPVNNFIFSDGWESGYGQFIKTNEWINVSYQTGSEMSRIGFEIFFPDGNPWGSNDFLEIDWIKITNGDESGWSNWSSSCEVNFGCSVNPEVDSEYMQYRLELETDDVTTTPRVSSVTLAPTFVPSGTFQSESINIAPDSELRFQTEYEVPDSGDLSLEYSVDEGESWQPLNLGTTNIYVPEDQSTFEWRATFSTTDPAQTPVIYSAALTRSAGGGSAMSSVSRVDGSSSSDEVIGENVNEDSEEKFEEIEKESRNRSSDRQAIIRVLVKVIIERLSDL